MARYIDADALRHRLMGLGIDDINIYNAIWDEPTVDLRKNVHGVWCWIDFLPTTYWECNCCSHPIDGEINIKSYKYCPNCGAEMSVENIEL